MFKDKVYVVGKHDEFSYLGWINDVVYKKNEQNESQDRTLGTLNGAGSLRVDMIK